MGELAFRRIRPLLDDDDVSGFSSGNGDNDLWFGEHAHRAMRDGAARVYVLPIVTGEICGFYALSAHAVARVGALAGSLRRNAPNPIPCTLLGQLAVDERYQGKSAGAAYCRTPFAVLPRCRASLRRGRLSSTRLTSMRRVSTPTLGFNVWQVILRVCSCGSSMMSPTHGSLSWQGPRRGEAASAGSIVMLASLKQRDTDAHLLRAKRQRSVAHRRKRRCALPASSRLKSALIGFAQVNLPTGTNLLHLCLRRIPPPRWRKAVHPRKGCGETRGRAVPDLSRHLGDTPPGQQQVPCLAHPPRGYEADQELPVAV